MASLAAIQKVTSGSTSAAAAATQTLSKTPRMGTTLVVLAVSTSVNAMTVSDSVDGNWIPDPAGHYVGAGALSSTYAQFFYLPFSSGGVRTITVSGTNIVSFAYWELDGASPPNAFKTSASATATASAAVTGAAVTANQGDIALAAAVCSVAVTGRGGGFSLDEHTNFGNNEADRKAVAADGTSCQPTWTSGSAADWLMVTARIQVDVGDSTFPSTSVLDDFNRPLTPAPPSSSWSSFPAEFSSDMKLSGDDATVIASTGSYSGDAWGTQVGPDCEVFVTKSHLDRNDDGIALYARVSSLSGAHGTWSGYYIFVDSVSVTLYRNNGASNYTYINQWSLAEQTGDSIGMRVTGVGRNVHIAVYAQRAGQVWKKLGDYQDTSASRVTGQGYIAVSAPPLAGGGTIDDFGGGTVNVFGNTPTLDDFERAGTTSPPSGNWTGLVYNNLRGIKHLQLSGDGHTAEAADNTNPAADYWSAAQIGPNCEVWATISIADLVDDRLWGLWARGSSLGNASTLNGYQLQYYPDGFAEILRWVGGVGQEPAGGCDNAAVYTSGAFGDGDSIGMSVIGTGELVVITVYHKPVGGSWRIILEGYDVQTNRVTAAGYVGVEIPDGTTPRLDAFGGGSLVQTLAPAKVASAEAVRGATLAGTGVATLASGKVASEEVVHGADVHIVHAILPASGGSSTLTPATGGTGSLTPASSDTATLTPDPGL